MYPDFLERTALLFGPEAMERLAHSRVAVFGLGGVGGYVVEALARSGVGALDLIDSDTVSLSNRNRQLLATEATLGRSKAAAAAERVRSINPDCRLRCHELFYLPETRDQFDFHDYDYVVDAIDTVTGKLTLIEAAREAGTPIISSPPGHRASEGGLLPGKTPAPAGEDPDARGKGAAGYPRLHGLRAGDGGADPGRRGGQGSDRLRPQRPGRGIDKFIHRRCLPPGKSEKRPLPSLGHRRGETGVII